MPRRDVSDLWIVAGLLLLALAGFVLAWTATQRFGPGMSPDALIYLCGAKNVAAGKGFIMPDGQPIVIWAPLFAHAIAAVNSVGLDLLTSARLVNSAAFSLLILSCGLWIRRTVAFRPFTIPGAASILLAKPLIYSASFVWSEVPFLLLMVLFLIEVGNSIRRPTIARLIVTGVLGAMMFLTRYAGYPIVAAGGLALLTMSSTSLKKRLRDVLIFAVACGAVVAPWLVRNYILSHTITGERHPSQVTLVQNAVSALTTMVSWQLPSTLPLGLRRAIFVMIAAVIAWAVVRALRKRGSEQHESTAPAVAAIALLIFVPLLVVSASKFATDFLQDRLLSPAYVLMVLLGVATLDRAVSAFSAGTARRVALVLATAGFCVWLLFPLHTAYLVWSQYRLSGPGRYLKSAWTDSAFARRVNHLPARSVLISNSPEAVFITTSRSAVVSTHTSRIAVYEGLPPGVLKFAELIRTGEPHYLIWYNDDGYRTYLHTTGDLSSVARFRVMYRSRSGAIYHVSAIPPEEQRAVTN